MSDAWVAYLALRFFVGGETGVIPPQGMGVMFGGVAGIWYTSLLMNEQGLWKRPRQPYWTHGRYAGHVLEPFTDEIR